MNFVLSQIPSPLSAIGPISCQVTRPRVLAGQLRKVEIIFHHRVRLLSRGDFQIHKMISKWGGGRQELAVVGVLPRVF